MDIRRYIDCTIHGVVRLTSEEYNRQMDRPDVGWHCPVCGNLARFHGEFCDCYDHNCNGIVNMDTDICATCGRDQYELYLEMQMQKGQGDDAA